MWSENEITKSDQSEKQICTPIHNSSEITSLCDTNENIELQENNSSIFDETRRSTRKRKLKYENYSYSSIARSQGLKGYPDMVDEEDYNSNEDEDNEEDDEFDYDYDGKSDYESATEESSGQSVSSEELKNLRNSVNYLASINSLNINKKMRNLKLKQCNIRQSKCPKYYRHSSRKVKPNIKRYQIRNKKNKRSVSNSEMVNGVRSYITPSLAQSNSSDMYDNLTTGNQAQVAKYSNIFTRDDNKNIKFREGTPVVVDSGIGFHNVGGLKEHINCLREMVVFPMIYRNVFDMFKQNPAKGVIFYGPPGTGKTLLARALANECCEGGQKVSFIECKSNDVLCKWIGESEIRLRLLFDKAKETKPSIIFIDELDGLVPVRSGKQDQVHNSIVTTMLAMMDGLEERGDVIVIGATNRIDSIDPALRRPGRFDKELYFPLPTDKDRLQILQIIISKWKFRPSDEILIRLSEETVGYTGADLNSLCSESVLQALNRTYPQIYHTSKRLSLDTNKIQVQIEDFEKAMNKIVPTTERNALLNPKRLPNIYRPLYERILHDFISYISQIFPELNSHSNQRLRVAKAPRLLVHSLSDSKNALVVPAFLQYFENCYRHTLSCVTLYRTTAHSPEEIIVQIFNELPKHIPGILYIPNIGELWMSLTDSLKKLFIELLNSMDITIPVLIFATSLYDLNNLPDEVLYVFLGAKQKHFIPNPSYIDIESLYSLLIDKALSSPKVIEQQPLEELSIATSVSNSPKFNETELKSIMCQEENILRKLRIFLRNICAKIARNKQFHIFLKPVNIEDVPDYLDIIKEPMDLETVMSKIDKYYYITVKDFLDDIDLIVQNALEYNPEKSTEDKCVRHRACSLKDKLYALIETELDPELEKNCQVIKDKRMKKEYDNSSDKIKKRHNIWENESISKKAKYSTNSNDYDFCSITNNDNFSNSSINGFDSINIIDDRSNDINNSAESISYSPLCDENINFELLPIICKKELIDFIDKDIMTFWYERINLNIDLEIIDDGIIDLFSLLDNKIGHYFEKWDRSTLIMELKKEFEDFKIFYVKD